MPAKKPLKTAPSESVGYPTGAPDSAKRLEAAEALAASKVDKLNDELDRLEDEKKQYDGDEVEEKKISEKIERAGKALLAQTKTWIELAKQVNSFYKAVDESKREGEKIPRIEVEEFFKQFRLSIKLAIEKYIISLSQDATRAESPEQFYQAHADNIRTAMLSEIENAQKDGKLPRWAILE